MTETKSRLKLIAERANPWTMTLSVYGFIWLFIVTLNLIGLTIENPTEAFDFVYLVSLLLIFRWAPIAEAQMLSGVVERILCFMCAVVSFWYLTEMHPDHVNPKQLYYAGLLSSPLIYLCLATALHAATPTKSKATT